MSTYTPDIKVFYGPQDADHRLIPAPDISISMEYNYSNDTPIGYTYIINLKGNATALDLRSVTENGIIPSNLNSGPSAIVDHLHKIRTILSQNGNVLQIIKSDNTNTPILQAKGGILRSFTIEDSPNNMVHFTPYSASIEFNSLDLGESTEDCENLSIDSSICNPCGIDLFKHKIKSFQDNWSFTFDENEPFQRIKPVDDITLDINNHSFSLQYTISAIGKHFFDYTNDETGVSNLLPAWEQAKNFVQFRLYNQVKNLITKVLKDTYTDGCTSSDGLAQILSPGSDGLLKALTSYKIFNEQITCDVSESDGSFSATYSAIVKSNLGNTTYSSPDTKHTVNKSMTTTYSNGVPITNISINGTIEGLVEGGLIYTNEALQLPVKGSLFIKQNIKENIKHNNAQNLLDKIYEDSDYNSAVGPGGKRDLKKFYKDALGVTMTALGLSPVPSDPVSDPPHPISFSLTHDYNAGTINYTVEYSSKKFCGQKLNEISLQTTNSNKVLVQFNVPSSQRCPIIQELGTKSAKKVRLSAKGIDNTDEGQPANLKIINEIKKTLKLKCDMLGYLPVGVPLPPPGTYIITQKSYTKNPIDGSYSLDMEYICDNNGCTIEG